MAQAAYLAGGGVAGSPAAVRFGIGAAPAVAAAAVAHLVHLIHTSSRRVQSDSRTTIVRSASTPAIQQSRPAGEPAVAVAAPPPDARLERLSAGAVRPSIADGPRPPRDAAPADPGGAAARAASAALGHRDRHGTLPTVTQLVHTAGVSRGTAGTVLKGLRSIPSRRSDLPSATEAASTATDQPQPSDASRTTSVDQPIQLPIKITEHHTPMHHDPQEGRPGPAAAAAR